MDPKTVETRTRETNDIAIEVRGVWKKFRLYHEKAGSLKALLLKSQKTTYEEFWALKDVSFQVPRGLTFGVIGENGSGKSTMLKLLSLILRPDKGNISVDGKVSGLLELGTGFHPELTGKENIYLNGSILGLSRKEIDGRFDTIVSFAELDKFIDTPVKSYSSGMYMRLGFAVAINVDPDILLIDEVLAVGDAAFQRKCFRQIEQFQEKGKTIVFVSHDLETVKKVCDVVLLLDNGNIVKMGRPSDAVNAYYEILTEKRNDFEESAASQRPPVVRRDDYDPDIKELAGFGGFKVSEYRYGHDEAKIIGSQLYGQNGETIKTVHSGEKCRIRTSISFSKEVKNPVVGMTIENPSGVEVYGTNTWYAEQPIGPQKPGDQVTIEFCQDMWLGAGTFSVSLGVVDFEGNEIRPLDRKMDILTFEVENNAQSLGLANLRSEVRIEKDD